MRKTPPSQRIGRRTVGIEGFKTKGSWSLQELAVKIVDVRERDEHGVCAALTAKPWIFGLDWLGSVPEGFLNSSHGLQPTEWSTKATDKLARAVTESPVQKLTFGQRWGGEIGPTRVFYICWKQLKFEM